MGGGGDGTTPDPGGQEAGGGARVAGLEEEGLGLGFGSLPLYPGCRGRIGAACRPAVEAA